MPGDTQLRFNALYQEHHEWLVRWIARRTSGHDSAQDLAHDTFMRLLDRPELTRDIRSPRGWLAKLAGNLVIDKARRQVVEKNYLALLASIPEAEHPSAETQWEILGLLEQIDKMLTGLKPKELTAFLMVRLDGASYKQAAIELGVSQSSVEKYIAKATYKCYTLAYPQL